MKSNNDDSTFFKNMFNMKDQLQMKYILLNFILYQEYEGTYIYVEEKVFQMLKKMLINYLREIP